MANTVLSYLESSASRFPDRAALTGLGGDISFSALRELAKRIGSGLCGRIGPGAPVGVYMEQETGTVAAFLGVVYAGGCYCFYNPVLPENRLGQMQEVLHAPLILTSEKRKEKAAGIFPGADILTAEELSRSPVDEGRLAAVRARHIDTDPLYIQFTSGSTGLPKGIAVCHRSVLDFIDIFAPLFGINEADVLANQAPFDFDVSVKDIYSCLKTGATLAVVPRPYFSEPVKLMDFLCEKKVTTMIWAVSALCLLTAFHALDYRVPGSVNKILFSGEVMPQKALTAFRKHLPEALYVNLYGPTEITCNCTYHILDPKRDYADGIPIGRPFPNEDVFLLDHDNRRFTTPGKEGEICVRGTALALGYYNCPAQNEAHFVQNPLNPFYPEIIYRTGDLGRYNEAGELFFTGRRDFQIKHMGHRIELEEIEREMAKIEGVERCFCLYDRKKARLEGFYVGEIDNQTLHSILRERLPVFMVPGILTRLDKIPLNKNGKIDRAAAEKEAKEA